jgi:hypothetical protein
LTLIGRDAPLHCVTAATCRRDRRKGDRAQSVNVRSGIRNTVAQ